MLRRLKSRKETGHLYLVNLVVLESQFNFPIFGTIQGTNRIVG